MTTAQEQSCSLDDLIALAILFNSCVQAFDHLHLSKNHDTTQKRLLTRLGIEQSRLLIWGDVVGISSPPPTVATRAVPLQPGDTNPDPELAINFGIRDARIDEPDMRQAIEEALNHLLRLFTPGVGDSEMYERYGLKPPKRFNSSIEAPLDPNRRDAFNEKFSLLRQLSPVWQRQTSVTLRHWTISDQSKFSAFISAVKDKVETLVHMMDVAERVDRGMKMDIKGFGWHPEPVGDRARQDWGRLRLIREACRDIYPEYADAADKVLAYLNEQLRESSTSKYSEHQPVSHTTTATASSTNSGGHGEHAPSPSKPHYKRPGFLRFFKHSGRGKSRGNQKDRSQSVASASSAEGDPARSKSESHNIASNELSPPLEPQRSLSMSAIPIPRTVDAAVPDQGDVARIKTADTSSKDPGKNDLSLVETVASH
ncbi:hypothetical protein H2201_008984, partial [Coniosporium apollinis]